MTGIGQVSMQSAAAPVGTTVDAAKHRRLTDAAQQFEGMFLQQMLKPLSTMSKEDGTDDKEDGDDKVGDNGTYQSLGVEAMAKAVSAAGGLGIARNIVASVEKESQQKHEDVGNIRQR